MVTPALIETAASFASMSLLPSGPAWLMGDAAAVLGGRIGWAEEVVGKMSPRPSDRVGDDTDVVAFGT